MRVFFTPEYQTPKIAETLFEAELDVIPRVGEYVCHYAPNAPPDQSPDWYEVLRVIHAYDQRVDMANYTSTPHCYLRLKKVNGPR